MERNVKYRGKQEPRGEVASGGGQCAGSPATLSNAPAPRDKNPSGHLLLRVAKATSPYPAHSSEDGTDTFTRGTGPCSARLFPPAPQSTLDGPASLRDGPGSILLHQGRCAKLAAAGTEMSKEVQGTIRNCDAGPSSNLGGRWGSAPTPRAGFGSASRNAQTSSSLTLRPRVPAQVLSLL